MEQTPSPSGTAEEEPTAETVSPSESESAPTPAQEATASGPAEPARAGQMRAAARPKIGQEIGGKKFRVGTGDEYVPFRSRTKRRRRLTAAGVFSAMIMSAGAYGVVTLIGSDAKTTKVGACPARADVNVNPAAIIRPGTAGQAPASAAPTAVSQIKLNVYNSTDRKGLAAATAGELKKRGFTIAKVANDPLKANLTVSAEVRGAAAAAAAMHLVAAEVGGSQLRPDARADGTVDLVLGSGFTALASPEQVTAALASPSPSGAKKGAAACR